MKKYLIMVLALITALVLTACEGEKEIGISVHDMGEKMLNAGKKLPQMSVVDGDSENTEDLFLSLSDIDYDKVEDYFYAYSSNGSADEVAVIKLKKSKDADETKESLRSHMQGRRTMFQSYKPEEIETIDNGLVFSNGRYVVLVIAKDSSKIKAEFEKMMEE